MLHPIKTLEIEKKFLTVIDEFLSKEECEKLIEHFEDESKKDKVKYIDRGIAEYFRLTENNPELANKLWYRVKDHIPGIYKGGIISNLNTYFRFSKYEPGMEFGIHQDGRNQDSNGNRAVFTLNIFLNDSFEGGSTDFFEGKNKMVISVSAKPGRAAIFDGDIWHRGDKVSNGCKYLLRTDVMLDTF